MLRGLALTILAVLACSGAAPSFAQALRLASVQDLTDLSLEELSAVRITSVSRRDQALLDAAASVYVIPGDEIRRSGATTLPEALRLAPNLQVAQIDARQYAISARGFNGNIANKLLVMVDGRTIYSPLFSGTFWDAQDFVPADIDRIEIISGPAGATWGTNAVNGVINVVTLPASRSQGAFASATAGTLERTVVARYGFETSQGLAVRAHARTFDRDASRLRGGGDAGDASRGSTAGLRADWSHGADAVTLIGGIYSGSSDDRPVYGSVDVRGSNLSARWSRKLGEERNFDLQAYYDSSNRHDNFLLQEDAQILDLEAKYRQTIGAHRWLAGLGYRRIRDRSEPGLLFAFFPAEQNQGWYSGFLQDEIALGDATTATLGLRLEHNPYTGWESLPSARIAYKLAPESTLWGALSRAVRSPSRFDREIFVPTAPPFFIAGGPDFVSEVATVAELGYRTQLGPEASLSATAFVQDYDRLRSGEIVGATVQFGNKIAGQVRGLEAWGSWRPMPEWRLEAGLLWMIERLHVTAGSTDTAGPSNLGNDPHVQWSLRSSHSIGDRLNAVVAVRHVGRLPAPVIPAYTATDLALHWRAHRDVQVSLGVRDAFSRRHAEYQGFSTVSEIPRSAFVAVILQTK